MRNVRKARAGLLGSLCIAVVAGTAAFSWLAVCRPMVRAPVFVPEAEHLNHAMLPAAAPSDPEELPDDQPPLDLADDNGEAAVVQWKPQHRQFRVSLTDSDQLWVRTFNFPGWTASVDGKPAGITAGEDLGDIEIDLPPGEHDVELDFRDTPLRRRAGWLTAGSFVFIAALTLVAIGKRFPTRR
jgi:hypothetical protein